MILSPNLLVKLFEPNCSKTNLKNFTEIAYAAIGYIFERSRLRENAGIKNKLWGEGIAVSFCPGKGFHSVFLGSCSHPLQGGSCADYARVLYFCAGGEDSEVVPWEGASCQVVQNSMPHVKSLSCPPSHARLASGLASLRLQCAFINQLRTQA